MGTLTFTRAPGEAPGMFALESALDELTYRRNVDPLELRLRNDAEHDCPHWDRLRPRKESGTAPFRTLFSRVDVPNPRQAPAGAWPLTPRASLRANASHRQQRRVEGESQVLTHRSVRTLSEAQSSSW